jgi:hypothetical protein
LWWSGEVHRHRDRLREPSPLDRYLLVCTPAGFERHWGRIAAASQGVEPPDWALQPIPEVIVVGPQMTWDG